LSVLLLRIHFRRTFAKIMRWRRLPAHKNGPHATSSTASLHHGKDFNAKREELTSHQDRFLTKEKDKKRITQRKQKQLRWFS